MLNQVVRKEPTCWPQEDFAESDLSCLQGWGSDVQRLLGLLFSGTGVCGAPGLGSGSVFIKCSVHGVIRLEEFGIL